MFKIGNVIYVVVEEDIDHLYRKLNNIKYEIEELENDKYDEIKDKCKAELIRDYEQQVKINNRMIDINEELIRLFQKELDIINNINSRF